MNPLNTLDAILSDWASPRTRRLIHAALALVLLVFTAYEAAGENWKIAIASLAAALYAAVNKANTPAATLDAAGEGGADDGTSYEAAGGQPFPEDPGAAPLF